MMTNELIATCKHEHLMKISMNEMFMSLVATSPPPPFPSARFQTDLISFNFIETLKQWVYNTLALKFPSS